MKNKYGDEKVNSHSWGESVGVSKALLCIANELAELNKILRKKLENEKSN